MAQLSTKIREYCKANGVANVDFMKDVLLEDKMVDAVSNPYIKEWNLEISKPTAEQIASYETAGNTAEALSGVLIKRKKEYKDFGYQLDLLYHDMTAGKLDNTGEWHKHIKAVKDANSKG
mgnify:CR=1 FL=1